MRLNAIGKLIAVLAVFLVSLMAVSAATDLLIGADIKITDGVGGDVELFHDSTPVCNFKLFSTNSLVQDDLGSLDVTVTWKVNNEIVAVDDSLDNFELSTTITAEMADPSLEVGNSVDCVVEAVWQDPVDADLNYENTKTASLSVGNNEPVLNFAGDDSETIEEDSGETAWNKFMLSYVSDDEDVDGFVFVVTSEDTSKVNCNVASDGSEFKYTPAADYANTNSNDACCTIQVTDKNGGKDTDNICFLVTNDNADGIAITSTEVTTATVDVDYEYNLAISNPDDVLPNYQFVNKPEWLNMQGGDKDGITLSGKPTEAGSDNVKLEISAPGIETVTEEYTITVSTPAAPSLNIADQTVIYGETFSLNVESKLNNPSNLPVSYQLLAKAPTLAVPAGMSFANKVVSWTPSELDEGYYYFTVKATYTLSGEQLEVTDDFKLQVKRPSCIEIYDVKAYAGEDADDKDSGLDENGGSIDEVEPGDKLKFTVEVKNTCEKDDENDFEVEDIEVTLTLAEMGDEGDHDLDKDYENLDDGDKSEEDFTINVPLDAEEGTYSGTIEAVGYDKDTGAFYEADFVDFTVKVEKENNKLKFKTFTLSPSTLSCNNNNLDLSVKLLNTGGHDEDVQLVISQDELNIEEIELFELEEGNSDDDDTYFKKTFSLNVPANAVEKTYVVTGKAYYNDDDDIETASAVLTIVPCGGSQTSTTTTDTTQDSGDDDDDVEVIVTSTPTNTPTQTTTTVDADDDNSFFDSSLYLGLLLAAILVVILVIVGLIVAVSRK
ncbi:hypothetical protein HN695_05830 [Candidatus Woesearchaeota archaeon]|jgi:hypothetical protein|nr:hypothetical protein [Candidatus Woesearchaeota archaeon]MBT5272599.1 hypothetical protein [Candidatus Woesearchaeota archaeon]MBT6040544.1 hypothetical protein [Candidatus Woesearchaeota archaeon]MBT6337151.1 hypothetical protein [Candidatus Woesearchaeota archaeon]MBT7927829.1 hypothetical protein [Candidatus Woesearchaeota archaeon]